MHFVLVKKSLNLNKTLKKKINDCYQRVKLSKDKTLIKNLLT